MTRNDLEMKITYSIHNLICGNIIRNSVHESIAAHKLTNNKDELNKDDEKLIDTLCFISSTLDELSKAIRDYALTYWRNSTDKYEIEIFLQNKIDVFYSFKIKLPLEAYNIIKDIIDYNYNTNWINKQTCIIAY
jgi:hypothetical protein